MKSAIGFSYMRFVEHLPARYLLLIPLAFTLRFGYLFRCLIHITVPEVRRQNGTEWLPSRVIPIGL